MKPTKHTVLITGGATGIGYAIARKFHAAGNRVILAGRSEKSLIQACNQMPGAEFSVSDISKPEGRDSLLQQFPDVNILVNNAGIQINTSILDSTPAQMEYELNINFLAAALLCRAYLPRMVQQTDATIINISSGLAIVPKENASMYCASKAALHSFSQSLRWQLENTPVRVFEVLPPLVDTAMTAGRGQGKITADQLADEFWRNFVNDRYQMLIGKTRLLAFINRFVPSLAQKIMRGGK